MEPAAPHAEKLSPTPPPSCLQFHEALKSYLIAGDATVHVLGQDFSDANRVLMHVHNHLRAFEDAVLLTYAMVASFITCAMGGEPIATSASSFLESLSGVITIRELLNIAFIATYAPGATEAILYAHNNLDNIKHWLLHVQRSSVRIMLAWPDGVEYHRLLIDQSNTDLHRSKFVFTPPATIAHWAGELNVKLVIEDLIVLHYARAAYGIAYDLMHKFAAQAIQRSEVRYEQVLMKSDSGRHMKPQPTLLATCPETIKTAFNFMK
eukprot:m.248983 g.248983  ORF g.248983 m.248983 type:complete len:265 (+) comp15914_c0_seq1:222-1016(+)